MKRRGAAPVWQRNKALFIAASLCGVSLFAAASVRADDNLVPVTDQKVNSPKEELRLKLFGTNAAAAGCGVVSIDPRGGTSGVDASLDETLRSILKAVKAKSDKELQPHFHKRLNVSLAAIAETFGKMDVVYGQPFDVSLFRLWALNTVDGSVGALPCKDDGLKIFPHYGYPLQMAAWLQIMGQKELGRVFVTLVPLEGRWQIGAFHVQQWTHASKDYAAWAEDGQKVAALGHKPAAFLRYDLAVKLLDGGGFVEFDVAPDMVKLRDQVMAPADWDKAVRDALPGFELLHTSSLLVVDGTGILIRIKIPAEISVENMKKTCRDLGMLLLKQPWSSHVEGIRCSFNTAKEDPKREGSLGSIYMSLSEIQKASKKP